MSIGFLPENGGVGNYSDLEFLWFWLLFEVLKLKKLPLEQTLPPPSSLFFEDFLSSR